MTARVRNWLPAGILMLGLLLVKQGSRQQRMPLRAPLDRAVPAVIDGLPSRDYEIPADEQAVAGMSAYIMRAYAVDPAAEATPAFSLYVSYYDSQTQGRTIHSPKNCLPGAGWEALASTSEVIHAGGERITVNRYLVQRGEDQALILYWYQGRGRVAASEYGVKWDLLRDAALRGRTEEALVRVMVPIDAGEADALERATRVSASVIPAVFLAMPEA